MSRDFEEEEGWGMIGVCVDLEGFFVIKLCVKGGWRAETSGSCDVAAYKGDTIEPSEHAHGDLAIESEGQ
jgi:hypothetical protein